MAFLLASLQRKFSITRDAHALVWSTSIHNPLSQDFERRLYKLARFAGIVEETLVARRDELDATLAEAAKRFPEVDRVELVEDHAEDFYELADELPTILRYAVLTSSDAALEAYLVDTCDTYADLGQARIRLTDLTGSSVQRTQQYLKKVASMQFPDQSESWHAVLKLRQLRNCIVHSDGYVGHRLKELEGWATAYSGVIITGDGLVRLSEAFTGAALRSYTEFATEFDVACAPLGLWESVFPFEDAADRGSDISGA